MKKILFTIFRQPITTVILSLLIAFGGVMGALGMPMQLVPDMKIPIVSIVVTYPGASAAVVEESVTSVMADSMSGVSGITGSYTYSYDNVGAVMLEFDFGTAVDEKLADVRERASALDLPDGCSSPEVSSLDLNGQATATIYVTSTEDSGSDVAYAASEAEKLAGKFSAIDGVGSVETDGEPSHRVSITPFKGLESITLLLVETLGGDEYDIPLGNIETENGTAVVRNLSGVATTDDIRALPVELPAGVMQAFSQAASSFSLFEGENALSLLGMLDGMTAADSPAKPLVSDLIAFKTEHPETPLGDDDAYALYELIISYDKEVLSEVPVIGAELSSLSDAEISPGLLSAIRSYDYAGSSPVILKIEDLAHVLGPGDEGYTPDYASYAFHNGKQGVKLSVYTAQGANAAEVVRGVKEAIAGFDAAAGTSVVLTDDQSSFISESVYNVLVSMLIGGALAVIVLFIFLKKIKPSLIISVTMPLSVLAALLLMFAMGITLNMVSLGGLAVGIGMLVDNSIVVIEAIIKRREAGDAPFRAAVFGTSEVAGALVGSTLTTVCVFIPILFVGGLCAEIFTDLAWAVIWSLAFSLLVAITVIPTLYTLFSPDRKLLTGSVLEAKAALERVQTNAAEPENEVTLVNDSAVMAEDDAVILPFDEKTAVYGGGCVTAADECGEKSGKRRKERRRERVITAVSGFYGRLVTGALRHKLIIILVMIVLFASSVVLAFATGTEFLPSVNRGQVEVNLSYLSGMELSDARADAELLANEISGLDEVSDVSVSVGVQGLLAFNNTGIISIRTESDATKLTQTVRELTRTVRDSGVMPHTVTATVSEIDGVVESLTGGMSDISVTVRGEDPDKLALISADIIEITGGDEYTSAGFENVTGASEDTTATEYVIDIDRGALAAAGVDYATAVLTLRVGLAGQTAATAVISGSESEVVVSFAEDSITSIDDLKSFALGSGVTVGDVAVIEERTAQTVIKKEDGLYAVTLTAEVYGLDSGSAGDMLTDAALQALDKEDGGTGRTYAENGYICVTSGVAEYLSDAFGGLYIALIVSFFLLFGVMAAQFRSVSKPLIIMCAIPFSFTGAFLALAITGITLNVVSLVGIIMLMGVIVNNAIVMLEKIKQLYEEEGYTHYDAVVEGCRTRLRPILMTTLTTILALIPLALGLGSGGELMQPLGVTVMGGLLVGTIVTLILIPCIYCGVKGISAKRPNGRE